MHQNIHLRYRLCGRVFPGSLPMQNEPNGAMLVHHLSAMHPTEEGPYLRRMAPRLSAAWPWSPLNAS
jgi:hypothetical protein